jgi:alcohol dehydrogenase class IV
MQYLNLNSRVIIKNNITSDLQSILKSKSFFTPLFCIDSGFYLSQTWKKYEKIFSKKINFKKIIIDCKYEPTYENLEFYRKKIKKFKKIDSIVAFGGGSCMDYSKALAALFNKSGKAINYRGFDKIKYPGIPCVCIPTTAGTGSEASYNASFVDSKNKIKMGINGTNMFAELAILDSVNTVSCPKFSAVGAAVDTFVHAIEGFVCKKSNSFTDLLSLEVIKIFYENVLDLNNKKPNFDKRLKLLYASYLSGIIQMNSGSGIASSISYPLSAVYKVPHGMGGGMFVLKVVKFNILNGFKKYHILSKYLNLKKKTANAFLNEFEIIFGKLGVPKKLGFFGLKKSSIDILLEKTLLMQKSFDQNPVKFNIKKIYKKFINNFF